MKLKSIDIAGFKSFPDAATLTFDGGITAVVGPNGCGKSNIVDAVRWVLGEQSTRNLRGGKMEDVIFSGTADRKPVGMAEVSLTIDNSDGSLPTPLGEVKVTRRLYRSGESEYLIAGRQVRLKDVNELFMNTGLGRDGYSLIGQGKIAEVLSVKGEERRTIFEEAAGISKYRYRRLESERRLKSTEDNLVRLRDILGGYASRVEPLRIQSEKAKKYLELRGERRQLEINVWLEAIERSKQQASKVRADFETVSAQLEDISGRQDEVEAQLEELSSRTAAANAGLDETVRAQRELERDSADSMAAAAVMQNDIEHNESRMEQLRTGAAGDEELSARLVLEGEELRGRAALLEAERGKISRELAELEAKSSRGQLEELEASLEELRSEEQKTAARRADLRIEAGTIETTLEEIAENRRRREGDVSVRATRLSEAKAQADEAAAQLESSRRALQAADNIVAGHSKRVDSRTQRLSEMDAKLGGLERAISNKEERRRLLEGLEQSMEGFSGAVKALLKASEQGRLRGLHGTIASVITVPEGYAVAIETALGAAMQNIVTDTEGDAKAAMNMLRSLGAGRATFWPIATIRGRVMDRPRAGAGYVGIASELVETDKRYGEIINYLLGRTAVAENLDAATAIARDNGYKFRIVTLDGQVVNAGGSMTGGSLARGSGTLSRRGEISSLEKELLGLAEQREGLRGERLRTAEELAAAKAGLEAAAAEGRVASENAIRLESRLAALNKELATLGDEQGWLQSERQRESAREVELSARLDAAADESRQLEEAQTALSQRMGDARESIDAERVRLDEIAQNISRLRVDALMADRDLKQVELDIDKNREAAELNVAGSDVRLAEIEGLKAENERLRRNIEELAAAREQVAARRGELEKRAASLAAERDETEADQTGLRRLLRETGELKENLVKEHTRLENRIAAISSESDNLVARLWDEYELTVSAAALQRTEIQSVTAANRRISELRGAIKALGNINIDSIEEYKEVKERYEFYTGQIGDLEKAKEELDSVIEQLTSQMEAIFAIQFKAINENFSRSFVDLFGGGTARLSLSDPSDVLESGIEIRVQPPGKLINSLAVLSGGEQALVAIALYFAIITVRPAPFVILDEIDTALDEVNVVRLGNYYKRFTSDSQLILVTHRRGAMEAANLLYGVTMQERGVSKLLRMDLSEAERLRLES